MTEFTTTAALFLDYAPVPLAFGTSGLRGLVKDITDLEAYINVKGALHYLMSSGDIRANEHAWLLPATCGRAPTGSCAPAPRRSSTRDVEVENAGKIPTPALISHAISNAQRRCDGDRQPYSLRP